MDSFHGYIVGLTIGVGTIGFIFVVAHMIGFSRGLIASTRTEIKTDLFRCGVSFMLLAALIKYLFS